MDFFFIFNNAIQLSYFISAYLVFEDFAFMGILGNKDDDFSWDWEICKENSCIASFETT